MHAANLAISFVCNQGPDAGTREGFMNQELIWVARFVSECLHSRWQNEL